MSLSVNLRAHEILDRMSDQALALGVSFSTLSNGARLVDLGVKAPGAAGWEGPRGDLPGRARQGGVHPA